MENGFNKIFNWYKKNKPEILEENYFGLKVGDIVKTTGEDFCIVYPSESYIAQMGLFIPVRYLDNKPDVFFRDETKERESGFKIFKCIEEPCMSGKTDFLAMEWLCWISDK